MEEGEREEGFVALLRKQVLFKLHKVSLQVDHLGGSAISPGHTVTWYKQCVQSLSLTQH